MVWSYLILKVENKGRTILENGNLVDAHTRKSDAELSPLPRNMWNAKGKKMMEAAKGALLNKYGEDGWELVSVMGNANEDNCYSYIFKRKED